MKKFLLVSGIVVLLMGCTGASSGGSSSGGSSVSTYQTSQPSRPTEVETPAAPAEDAPVEVEDTLELGDDNIARVTSTTAVDTPPKPTTTVTTTTTATSSSASNATSAAVGTGFARISGKTFKVTNPARLADMTIAFEGDGNFGGDTLVNRIFGKAKWSGSRVEFGKIGSTKMMSDSESMRNENEFISLLENAKSMTYAAGSLMISSDISITLTETNGQN